MALPLSTDLVVNLLRESVVSIQQDTSDHGTLALRSPTGKYPDSSVYANNSNSGPVIGSVIGSLYRAEAVGQLTNVKQDFPLLTQLALEETKPIKVSPTEEAGSGRVSRRNSSLASISRKATSRSSRSGSTNAMTMTMTMAPPLDASTPELKEEDTKKISGAADPTKDQTRRTSVATTQSRTKNQSTSASDGRPLPPVPPRTASDSTKSPPAKKKGIFSKLMRRKSASDEAAVMAQQAHEDHDGHEDHGQTYGMESDDSDDDGDDSSLTYSSDDMVVDDEINTLSRGSDSVGGAAGMGAATEETGSGSSLTGPDSLDVSSIESSVVADDDDSLMQGSLGSPGSPNYLTGDPEGEYYSDDYLDSDEYLSDSEYFLDDSSTPSLAVRDFQHPVSRINFTRSRAGTFHQSYRNIAQSTTAAYRSRAPSLNTRPLAPPPKSYQNLRATLKRSSQSLTDVLVLDSQSQQSVSLDFTKRPVPPRGSAKASKLDTPTDGGTQPQIPREGSSQDLSRDDTSVSSLESLPDSPTVATTTPKSADASPSSSHSASSPTIPPPMAMSKLTALIKKNSISLDYYSYVAKRKSSADAVLPVSMNIPGLGITPLDPLELEVNTSCQVVEVIGYVLLTLKKKNLSALKDQQLDPNRWCLYLADEDGEAEDDFGVLDRTRELKSYNEDEFVMYEVSDEDMRKNEAITPSPLELAEKQTQEGTDFVPPPQQRHLRNTSLATIQSNVTMGKTPRIRSKSLQKRSSSGRTLESLDEENDNNSVITSYSGGEPAQQPSQSHLPQQHTESTLLFQQADKHNTTNSDQMALTGYHRWTVWRRQQMSFKGRHPRTLAIDGNEVYILPFDESKGMWYDAKTTTFNVNQVQRVKQSSKVPRYFKIIVDKHYDGVLKKYYLEAKNVPECKEIVQCIKGLIPKSKAKN